MRLPILVSFLVSVAGSNLAAQELFTRSALEHVPDTTMFSAVMADFDADGDLDVFGSGLLQTNFLGRFVESGQFSTGGTILGAYDFDGDGRPDLLDATSSGLDRLGISLNRLPFTFDRRSLGLTSGSQVEGHAVADFDQDGDLDIILAPATRSVPVLQLVNDGTGSFTDVTASRMPPLGIRVEGVHPIDFDGDGDLDLLVPDRTSGPVSLGIMINQGGGVFSAPDTTLVQSAGRDVLLIADLDADGDPDFLANDGRLVENLGGTFADAAVQPMFLTSYVDLVQSGDIDGDGDLDLFVEYNGGSYRAGWFENVGAGMPFVDRRLTGAIVRRDVSAVEVTDIDRDGNMDVLAVGSRIQVLLGQPSGEFVDMTPELPQAQIYGDYNGDGYLDSLFYIRFFELFIRRGDGVGGFTESRTAPGVGVVRVLNQADVDMDGDLDLLFWGPWPSNGAGILVNDGAGNFSLRANSIPGNVDTVAWSRFGDLDGDGDPDLVVRHSRQNNTVTEVLMNDGTGGFAVDPTRLFPLFMGDTILVEVLDADADGDLDMIVAFDDPVLYRNDGTGAFTADTAAIPARFPTVGDRASTLSVADVDGDGDLDFLAAHTFFNNPSVATNDAVLYENNGAGVYSVRTVFNESSDWTRATLADVDSDGDQDLLVSTTEFIGGRRVNKAEILENDGAGVLVRGVKTLGGLEGLPSVIQDIDDDGDIDLGSYVNNTAQIRVRFVPRLGGTLNLQVPNPSTLFTQSAIVLISAARFAQAVQFPTLGQLAVDPSLGFSMRAFSRFRGAPANVDLPIPNVASLAGVKLYAQALVLLQPRLTNAITVTLAR